MSKVESSGVRRYLANAGSSVVTRLLQVTVLVWVNQHLLRRIPPEEYSLFPVVLSLMFFADVFKNMVTGGITRFIVEADSRDDHSGVKAIVSSMFPVVFLAAFLFLVAGGLAAWKLDDLLNLKPEYLPQARLMLLILVCSLSLTVLASPFADGLYIRQRFLALNIVDLSCEALRVAILLTLLIGVSTSVLWLVVASAAASVINLGIRVFMTRRLIPSILFKPESFSLERARTLLKFGAWTSVQGFTSLISSTAPVLLLNRFGTPVDVAVFYLGRLPEIQIRALASVAAAPALPAMTRIFALRGEGSLNDLYYRGGRYFLWTTLFLVPPFLIFGRQIFELYAGSTYAAAGIVALGLLGAYPFLWASAMFYQVAHAIGKIGAYYMCDIVVQAITLLAIFLAVGLWGLGAAGAGLAIGHAGAIIHVALIWPMGLRLVHGRWKTFFRETFVPGSLPFCVALGALYGCSLVATFHSWLTIGCACLLSAGAYATVLFGFCLDPLDRDLLGRLFSRLKLKFPFNYLCTAR